MREEVELLEDHADFCPDFIEVGFFIGEIDAIDIDMAAVEDLQAVDTAEKSRFTGAGRTDDDHHLALGNLCGDSVHRPDGDAAAGEYALDVYGFNH